MDRLQRIKALTLTRIRTDVTWPEGTAADE